MTGRVFDIRRYSIHDGPGIRTTVFMKGCPLHCAWCHNPEGIGNGLELMQWPSRCAGCHACLSACPLRAISNDAAGAVAIDRAKCDGCGACAETCLYDALQPVGRDVSVAGALAEIERDRIFYEQSGGGVTFSGGEPLAQPEFLEAMLDALRSRGVSAAVDTSGLAPADLFARIAAKSDLVLFDLKHMDDRRHREYTGVSNVQILENLRRLAAGPTPVWIRIPLIAGINDGEDDVRDTIAFLTALRTVSKVGLLPYHAGGLEKAARLGAAACFRGFEPPSEARLAAVRQAFSAAGFDAGMGG